MFGTALSSRIGKSIFLCFTPRFLRIDEKCYTFLIHLRYNSERIFKIKLTVDEVIAKVRHHAFLKHTVYNLLFMSRFVGRQVSEAYCFRSSSSSRCPAVCCSLTPISVRSREISMKLATNIHRVSGNWVNSFSTRLLSSCTDEYAHTYDISTY